MASDLSFKGDVSEDSQTTPADGNISTTQTVNFCSEQLDNGFAYPTWGVSIIMVICTVIIVGTIVGNLLVCTAVSIVRRLRTPSNWLIVSLAVADLLVAVLDMPFATMYEVKGCWILDKVTCEMWTSLDVLLCTASILNLCMISIDRYLVITRPFDYALKRTPLRMALMILAVWSLSALISIPPLFGWKAEYMQTKCELSQEVGYQFYATIGAFYLPLAIMIIIYARIYVLSSRIAKAESKPKKSIDRESSSGFFSRRKSSGGDSSHHGSGAKADHGSGKAAEYGRNSDGRSTGSRQNSDDTSHSTAALTSRKSLGFLQRGQSRNSSVSPSKSERKATKTLGVIMGAFTVCWLPFFILALVRALLTDRYAIPHELESMLLWFGYTNSFLNPIIYARFNRDFRTPFKEILLCRCSGINVRLRSESYTEQFGPSNDSNRRSSVARRGSGGYNMTEQDGSLKLQPQQKFDGNSDQKHSVIMEGKE